jgi:two-component system sensor histidine kinase KdpD
VQDRPDPDALLAALKADEARAARGRLKIFLGANAGVGKTYAMLQEARGLAAQGTEVVAGLIETHGRAATEALLHDFEVLPRRQVEHRGTTLHEFDLDAALARRPRLLLVDELAHTNAPGSRHAKRWQDVEELIASGIDVYTTVNVQHLESLNDQVVRLTGVQVWETVPDRIIAEADEVELIDIPPDELLARLREGRIYGTERAAAAEQNFFRRANLIALRELALRETAARVESELQAQRRREGHDEAPRVADRVLACVGADEFAPLVIREAARLATALRAEWVALYVETPALARADAEDRERVLATLKLAESLGAETVTLGSVEIARSVLDFAARRGVTRIVIGQPTRGPLLRRLAGSLVETLIQEARGVDLQIVAQPAGGDILENRGSASRVAGLGQSERRALRPVRFAWSLLLVAGACGLGALLYPEVPSAGVVMLFLLAVVLAGVYLGRAPAALAAVSGGVAFNYFFTAPRFTLYISTAADLLTFVALLAVGLVIAELAARARHQTRVALQREERAVSLGLFTESLLTAGEETALARQAVEHVSKAFDADVALLLPDEKGTVQVAASVGDGASVIDTSIARWVFDRRQAAGLGTDTLPSSPMHYAPVEARERVHGVLALRPRAVRRLLLPEPRRALEQFARQTALALERLALVRQARDAELAVRAEDLRNALLSGLSHDLRTPLASIVGASSALLETPGALATAASRDLVRTVNEEAVRMTRLATNLLDMARFTSGTVALRREWVPLEELVGGVRNRLAPLLAGRPFGVTIEPGAALLHVDPLLFEQLLQNLIENAARYSPPGTPIDVVARPVEAGDTAVRIAVQDRGPGIPDAMKEAVFEKFFRGHPEAAQSGTGLGLALAAAIATLHGARLWVEDRTGGGAAFHVQLPRADAAPPAAAPEASP